MGQCGLEHRDGVDWRAGAALDAERVDGDHELPAVPLRTSQRAPSSLVAQRVEVGQDLSWVGRSVMAALLSMGAAAREAYYRAVARGGPMRAERPCWRGSPRRVAWT